MNHYTLADMKPGLTESFTVTVTQQMMDQFLAITGDCSPIHVDADYAQDRGYPGCVVYGMPMVAYDIGAVTVQASCDNIASVLLAHLRSLK